MGAIKLAMTDEDILLCFPAYKELRPHLHDKGKFVIQVKNQQNAGFKLNFIKDIDTAAACIGYRVLDTLAWGKIIYIDDLITRELGRGKGYANLLLQYVEEQAKQLACNEIHLDTGYQRYDAHRLYLKNGFKMICHHLSKSI